MKTKRLENELGHLRQVVNFWHRATVNAVSLGKAESARFAASRAASAARRMELTPFMAIEQETRLVTDLTRHFAQTRACSRLDAVGHSILVLVKKYNELAAEQGESALTVVSENFATLAADLARKS